MPKKGTQPSDTEGLAPAKTVKAKSGATKATKKTTKPTTVKKPAKGKKATVKKPKKPVITDRDFENYFFKLSHTKFIQLTKDWNDVNLKIKLTAQTNYDGWLNYFKSLSPNKIRMLAQTGLDILPTEGYAALAFWHDIISNPSRINKIHRAGLTTGAESKSIVELAAKNDRYGVLCAIRDDIASKLQKGAGNRDTSDLSKQLAEIMTQIEYYDKQKAKSSKKTVLGDLMASMPTDEIKDKRPAKNGGGRRQTSFASRVTIKDLEGKK